MWQTKNKKNRLLLSNFQIQRRVQWGRLDGEQQSGFAPVTGVVVPGEVDAQIVVKVKFSGMRALPSRGNSLNEQYFLWRCIFVKKKRTFWKLRHLSSIFNLRLQLSAGKSRLDSNPLLLPAVEPSDLQAFFDFGTVKLIFLTLQHWFVPNPTEPQIFFLNSSQFYNENKIKKLLLCLTFGQKSLFKDHAIGGHWKQWNLMPRLLYRH